MKKLLSILGSLFLMSTSAISVASCSIPKKTIDISIGDGSNKLEDYQGTTGNLVTMVVFDILNLLNYNPEVHENDDINLPDNIKNLPLLADGNKEKLIQKDEKWKDFYKDFESSNDFFYKNVNVTNSSGAKPNNPSADSGGYVGKTFKQGMTNDGSPESIENAKPIFPNIDVPSSTTEEINKTQTNVLGDQIFNTLSGVNFNLQYDDSENEDIDTSKPIEVAPNATDVPLYYTNAINSDSKGDEDKYKTQIEGTIYETAIPDMTFIITFEGIKNYTITLPITNVVYLLWTINAIENTDADTKDDFSGSLYTFAYQYQFSKDVIASRSGTDYMSTAFQLFNDNTFDQMSIDFS
ncbi:hypothetical protein [Spiroplasma endosymbiont of Labia minor]|uniref:hypothetical protein n=1 Tax=Spiroplasma endosymbiont of Labia minor TaxID=3066305 RepID=UPI0030D4470C